MKNCLQTFQDILRFIAHEAKNIMLTFNCKSSLNTFIYNVNLKTKVRTLLRRGTTSKNFSELKTIKTKYFKCTKTVYRELGNLTQRNTITNLREICLELTSLLHDIQIAQRGENNRESIIQ